MTKAATHNWIIAGVWIAVIGAGLYWLYNRNQTTAKTTAAPAAPASPAPASTTANV